MTGWDRLFVAFMLGYIASAMIGQGNMIRQLQATQDQTVDFLSDIHAERAK